MGGLMQRYLIGFLIRGVLALLSTASVAFGANDPTSAVKDGEWAYLGGGPESHQYSPLNQINSQNIGRLGLLWYSDLPIPEGLVGNPLVKEGVVYSSWAPGDGVVATELADGEDAVAV